jgi:hypothetical protein
MRESVRVISPCGWNLSHPPDSEPRNAYEPVHQVNEEVVVPELEDRWSHIIKAGSGERSNSETRAKSACGRSRAVSLEEKEKIACSQNACERL